MRLPLKQMAVRSGRRAPGTCLIVYSRSMVAPGNAASLHPHDVLFRRRRQCFGKRTDREGTLRSGVLRRRAPDGARRLELQLAQDVGAVRFGNKEMSICIWHRPVEAARAAAERGVRTESTGARRVWSRFKETWQARDTLKKVQLAMLGRLGSRPEADTQ